MSLRPLAFCALLFLVVGCRHLDRQYAQVVDDLVARKATKTDALREFGTPVSSSVDGNSETVVYVPAAKSSRKTITKVINGVEHKEETIVASAGKLRITLVYVAGVVASGSVTPNR